MKFEKQHHTLCWDCAKNGGKCSWSKDFTPVEGWKAIPTTIKSNARTGDGREYTSFDIYECPEFELMGRLRK